jgi:hypothetical protein
MRSKRVPGRGAENGTSGQPGSNGRARRIGCAAIALAAAVPLGLYVHDELRGQSRGAARAATAAYRQEECIYRAIRRDLPKGATIYIYEPAAVWTNGARVLELSTTWAVPQPTAATAGWAVTLVPKPGPCLGAALEVRRR